jgi:hypothetical protein
MQEWAGQRARTSSSVSIRPDFFRCGTNVAGVGPAVRQHPRAADPFQTMTGHDQGLAVTVDAHLLPPEFAYEGVRVGA